MHSWRVLLLPFLGKEAIYRQYHFNEPWNSFHNRSLAHHMPAVYRCPSSLHGDLCTNYVAVVGDRSAWPGEQTVRFGGITDRKRFTILLVELPWSGVNWMTPSDITYEEIMKWQGQRAAHGSDTAHSGTLRCLFADGSNGQLPATCTPELLSALLSVDGGEQVAESDTGSPILAPRVPLVHETENGTGPIK